MLWVISTQVTFFSTVQCSKQFFKELEVINFRNL
jgi:hypothetical protein